MPSVRHRHNTAPLYKERIAFLTHMQAHDRKYNTIRAMASHLLQINRTLGFSKRMRVLTVEELKGAAWEWAQYAGALRKRVPGKFSYELYMRIARGWLRFHSCRRSSVYPRASHWFCLITDASRALSRSDKLLDRRTNYHGLRCSTGHPFCGFRS